MCWPTVCCFLCLDGIGMGRNFLSFGYSYSRVSLLCVRRYGSGILSEIADYLPSPLYFISMVKALHRCFLVIFIGTKGGFCTLSGVKSANFDMIPCNFSVFDKWSASYLI